MGIRKKSLSVKSTGPLNFAMSAFFGKNSAFFGKNGTFSKSNSVKAGLEIFCFIFSFCKIKGYF